MRFLLCSQNQSPAVIDFGYTSLYNRSLYIKQRFLRRKAMKTLMTLIFLLGLAGCSGEDETAGKGDHVWKEQTDTIKKAEQVEGMVMDAAKAQRDAVDNQER